MNFKTVYLHGDLGKGYPTGPFVVNAATASEITSYFQANFGDFHNRIRNRRICVVAGNLEGGIGLDETTAGFRLSSEEVHIMPEAMGAKNGGAFKAILGAVLIGVALFASGGTMAGLGAAAFGNGLGITGTQIALLGVGLVAAAFVQAPKSNYSQRNDDKPSGVFQGALNTQAEGNPVPYVAGRGVIVGGQIVHAAVDVNQVPVEAAS